MPVLQIRLTTAGAILEVEVDASAAYRMHGAPTAPYRALIDTGASMTAISPAVLAAVGAQQIGVTPVTQPNGATVAVDTYDVRVRFGAQGRHYSVEVVATQPATPDVDVLIGVDLLLRIRMGWDGRGRPLTLSFK